VFEAEKSMKIEVDQFAKKVLLDRGYSPDLGARPLERAVDEMIMQPLVDAWFGNRLRTGTVRFTASDSNMITFSQD
jgi:ATP-dependent Clp protease ATP-binding subunit ClpA